MYQPPGSWEEPASGLGPTCFCQVALAQEVDTGQLALSGQVHHFLPILPVSHEVLAAAGDAGGWATVSAGVDGEERACAVRRLFGVTTIPWIAR